MPTGSRTLSMAISPALTSASPEPEQVGLAAVGLPCPGTGEAVGLLFGDDRRESATERAAAGLDRVAVLVGQHDAHHGRAELGGEWGQDVLVVVVVDHEVAELAVEGDEEREFLVVRTRFATSGEVGFALRVAGVHATFEWSPVRLPYTSG